MSSSRTNIRSAGKFAARALRLFLPLSIRRPASRNRSRLSSDRRPERWTAMCRRVRSTDIAGLECVDRPSISLVRLLAEEPPDPNDGGRAHARCFVNVAIGKVGAIEQPGNVPALSQRSQLGGRAKIAQ